MQTAPHLLDHRLIIAATVTHRLPPATTLSLRFAGRFGFDGRSPASSEPTLFAASRLVSSYKCAYRMVVSIRLWPIRLPSSSSGTFALRATDANACLGSGIRRS